MGSGNSLLLFLPNANVPPASNFATLDLRNGHLVLDFDASTDEAAIFKGVLPQNYSGGGLTLKLHFAMSSATSGNVVLEASIERIGDDVQDIDSDGFASAQSSGAVAVSSVSGQAKIATIAFTSGAQMDSLAAGEAFRLKISRDADNAGSDTATGDLELIVAELRET